jgi:hypothetical protein
VLIAYQHPGSGGSRLGLAISRQAGHTFAERLRVVRANGAVREPRIAMRGNRIALAWLEEPRSPGATKSVVRTRVRVGVWR